MKRLVDSPNTIYTELDKPLTPLELRFVQEYLKDFNGAEAARRAGSQCSKENAKRVAYQMLQRPNVQQKVQELQGKLIEDALISEVTIIKELQHTATEARMNNKFDAAVKAYEKIADILGYIGDGRKMRNAGEGETRNTRTSAFVSGDNSEDMDLDIEQFLGIMNKTVKN